MMKKMKRAYIIIIVLLTGTSFLKGQVQNTEFETFKSDVSTKFREYFSDAGKDQSGQFRLTATLNYSQMSASKRKDVMSSLLRSRPATLVIVHLGSQRELWAWNSEAGNAGQLDAWDLNPAPATSSAEEAQPEIAKHPWFFYIGGAQQMDSNKNLNGALNVRVGFFLLRDKMDLAVSLSELLSGNLEAESASMTTSIGLASKYYLVIKNSRMRPNLGAELAVSIPSGGSTALTPSALAGISWFVGPGCFDAGLRVGSSSMLLFGYTFIPKLQ